MPHVHLNNMLSTHKLALTLFCSLQFAYLSDTLLGLLDTQKLTLYNETTLQVVGSKFEHLLPSVLSKWCQMILAFSS